MFLEANGNIRFETRNEIEGKLLNHIKRQNSWVKQRRFNDFRDNQDGTITLFIKSGHETLVSKDRLSGILRAGKVTVNRSKGGRYAQINASPLSRFLLTNELSKYEGFTEETGMKLHVNHIDENKMNNTDDNLEVLTVQENNLKYGLNHARGYFKVPSGKFQVEVCGKYVGVFKTKEKAREAYLQAAKAELKRLEEFRINWLKSKGRL